MKAAVSRQVGSIEVEDIDRPAPSFGEVLVKLGAVGVCQTDHSALAGRLPVPMPIVLGHEGAGVVESVGAGVDHLSPGDHIVLSITAGCGRCSSCQSGAFTLCHSAAPHGSIRPHVDIPAALDAFMDGRLPLDRLIQRRIALEELPAVFAAADPGVTGPGRTVVVF